MLTKICIHSSNNFFVLLNQNDILYMQLHLIHKMVCRVLISVNNYQKTYIRQVIKIFIIDHWPYFEMMNTQNEYIMRDYHKI